MTAFFLGLLFITSGMAAIIIITQSISRAIEIARFLRHDLAFLEAAKQLDLKETSIIQFPAECRSSHGHSLRPCTPERKSRWKRLHFRKSRWQKRHYAAA
ncbi:hypothetical protein [Altericroceibacterium spongiae]|uniref:hypothetical protein n=1 Tax=Altericroceibacterium spongiae TaxID=2320269 RepID=UPI0011C40D1D|nr:hypothetical protein [Altericroceibacterium spongiae]